MDKWHGVLEKSVHCTVAAIKGDLLKKSCTHLQVELLAGVSIFGLDSQFRPAPKID